MNDRMTVQELEVVADALRRNRMAAHCVQTKEEVVPLVKSLLTSGSTVAVGGSVSLSDAGVMELLRSGEYHFLDRYAEGLSDEERNAVLLNSMQADAYLCSSNAVTRKGELYNVDGRANRIAAIAYGPALVVLVVGCNKIVDTLDDAVRRVKTVAAPMNAKRLHCDTYCATFGTCRATDSADCTDGCLSPDRICADYLVSGWQRIPDRIHVILVGEALGF